MSLAVEVSVDVLVSVAVAVDADADVSLDSLSEDEAEVSVASLLALDSELSDAALVSVAVPSVSSPIKRPLASEGKGPIPGRPTVRPALMTFPRTVRPSVRPWLT